MLSQLTKRSKGASTRLGKAQSESNCRSVNLAELIVH